MCYVNFEQTHQSICRGRSVLLLLMYNVSGPAKTFTYKLALNTKFRRKHLMTLISEKILSHIGLMNPPAEFAYKTPNTSFVTVIQVIGQK